MILGMSIGAFTSLHVNNHYRDRKWTDCCRRDVRFAQIAGHNGTVYFHHRAFTSVTGFLFPIHDFTPASDVGILACVILLIALFALYKEHLVGAWRWIL